MRGSIVKRSKTSWSLVVDQGRDPSGKRRQKWIAYAYDRSLTVRENSKAAEAALAALLNGLATNTYIDPSKTTVLAYLRKWVEETVKPTKRPATFKTYASMIETHIAPARIASIPVQKLRKSDLEHFFNVNLKTLAPASVGVAHALLSKALNDAVDDGVLAFNAAARAKNRRKVEKDDMTVHATRHCWTAAEAKTVLATPTSPQLAAFVALALDSGARKSELHALGWADVDLDHGVVTLWRQLDRAGTTPVYGPLKTKGRRTVTLMASTVTKLRTHKKAQAELKMRHRTTYQDHGLVFAKEAEDLTTPEAQLGQPTKQLSAARFQRLVQAARVKPIRFHGLRHTSATLLLQAGVPITVVSKRLGHSKVSMTLDRYAHVLPGTEADAAQKLGALLA